MRKAWTEVENRPTKKYYAIMSMALCVAVLALIILIIPIHPFIPLIVSFIATLVSTLFIANFVIPYLRSLFAEKNECLNPHNHRSTTAVVTHSLKNDLESSDRLAATVIGVDEPGVPIGDTNENHIGIDQPDAALTDDQAITWAGLGPSGDFILGL